jgi:LmbE family N-acetylglucosaminyl deacetylase
MHVGPDVMACRRDEDHRALAVLGAAPVHLTHMDAMYRMDDNEPLFVALDRVDEIELVERLYEDIASRGIDAGTMYYAPLAIGGHRDHLLVHEAARRLHATGVQVRFYEDLPYAINPAHREAAVERLRPRRDEVVRLDEDAMQAKIEALLCYTSQARMLGAGTDGDGAEKLTQLCRGYAMFVAGGEGFGERYWLWEPEGDVSTRSG